jgi:hypothetical protein
MIRDRTTDNLRDIEHPFEVRSDEVGQRSSPDAPQSIKPLRLSVGGQHEVVR